jgi:hypothetical protein
VTADPRDDDQLIADARADARRFETSGLNIGAAATLRALADRLDTMNQIARRQQRVVDTQNAVRERC